ncbi:MAG TPA: protein kinase, partial [Polyangiales bacterium]|nr:protein kinase [Polyangiales bacterium]
MPGPGSLIDNKYRVEELLARGGMGVVYAATHTVSSKRVALKWMLPALGQIKGARERFIQEACATARIAHPNIVDIYDVGSENGSAYLVMEYLRGETLADRMCRQRLPVVDAVSLL